jgi:ATP-binding cassette subfamily B protein
MQHFRVTFQQEQEDCGAACLAMITRFYGFHVSQEAIKAFCGSMKSGLNMYGLNCAAQRIGFKTQAVRLNEKELSNLPTKLFPFIAHWNQNHFVVVYKSTSNYFYVADPAIGRVRYRRQEFLESFAMSDDNDGFALLLEPSSINAQIFHQEKPEGLKLLDYIKPRRKQLTLVVFSLVALSIIELVFPFLTQAIVDKGIAEKDTGLLGVILCATIALTIGRALFGFLQSRMTLVAGTFIDIDLAYDLLVRLSTLPMGVFASRKVGDMIQRVFDVSRVGDYFSSRLAESILSIVMFCIYGGILLHLYPMLFAVFMTGAFLYVGYLFLFLHHRKILDYEFFNAASKSQEELIQYLRGMTELKLACAENKRLEIWRTLRHELFGVSSRSLTLTQKQELGSVFLLQIVDAISIFIMAKAVIDGSTTLGSMMAVQYIIGSLESPLRTVTTFIQDTQSVSIAFSRINYIASETPEQKGGVKVDFTNNSPTIYVNGVTFSYDINAGHPALQNICAVIPSGKTTALVGMSGSGKTTLLKLFLGFYSPDEGSIQIDNIDLSEIDLSVWRKNVGVVMQDGYIFSDNIINNIALGDSSPSIEHVKQSLHIACADFVFDLPVGLHTKIGAEGMSLSSGQRQRILLARAIYKHPTIFFLDEATNALDAINERNIYENLHKELKGKTVVIAAHRLSTISNADQILVFDGGQIVEYGTHEELIKRNGKYSELVQNQRFG